MDERAILEALDAIITSNAVRTKIRPIVARVRADLAARRDAVMAWEPIPLETFGGDLPPGIKSGWVFILRAGVNTGAERHPNSHQRMMSFEGTGDLQTQGGAAEKDAPSAKKWQSNVLVSDPEAPLERKWISIPRNVWHRPVVSKEADWVVVSFHTVSAKELIEERPGEAAGATRQMIYLNHFSELTSG
jgi:hypothetical protein